MQEYLLVVRNQKGFPRFEVYKSAANSIDILNNTDFVAVAGGASVSYQDTEPNGVSTFTLAVSEP